MKRIMKMAAFALVLVLGSSLQQKLSAQYDDGDYDQGNYDSDREVSYQTFYDELSPHGRWVDYPGQGYVWVPDAGPDFRPYSTNGHWVWSDNYEWVWVSEYDWGWAPFHYGRWDNDPHYGWYWVPGYEWSPAWVAWRDGGDYYGWAPIRPGINISINFNIGGYAPPVNFWVFSPRRYLTSPRLYDYCVDPRRNVTIINYTTIISNNYRYNRNYGFSCGPRRYDAERYTGRINPVRFRQSNRPGRTTFRNNEVSVYRPNVRRDENRTIAPRRFDRYDNNAGNRVSTRNDNGGFRRNENPVNTNNDRNDRRIERDDRTTRPNTNTGNVDNRRFERKNEVVRQQQPQQQPQQQQQQQQTERRRFERKDDGGIRQQQQQQPQQQQPQMERKRFERNDNGATQRPQQVERQRPQQMERQKEVRAQQQPQPQRQFERKDNGSRHDIGGGKGNNEGGGGKGKKRF